MKYTFVVAALLITSTLQAQTTTAPLGNLTGWYLDVHAGFNKAVMSGSGVDRMAGVATSHGSKLRVEGHKGFEAGINVRKTLGDFFHVKSGINFSQRGTTLWNTPYVEFPVYQSSYIGIPLLVGFATNYRTDDKMALSVDAGIALFANSSTDQLDWIIDTHAVTDFIFQPELSFKISPMLTVGIQYRYAKDLNSAYTFFYSNVSVPKDYEHYYTTKALLVSVRLKLPNPTTVHE
ncbi:MAG: outer membrane beta-barrel protein [Cyclobacteriaceae bacterium]|nr:outer membrane beta-barrel protein [Cyclobacteriaceae bacterium]